MVSRAAEWLRGHVHVLFLTVLVVVLVGTGLVWDSRIVGRQQAIQRHEQIVQERQGAVLEDKLCATLDSLADLSPPAGSPKANPSRAYLQQQHAVLAELGSDLGCRQEKP